MHTPQAVSLDQNNVTLCLTLSELLNVWKNKKVRVWLRVWVCGCWLRGCLRGCAVVGVGVVCGRVGVCVFFFELRILFFI